MADISHILSGLTYVQSKQLDMLSGFSSTPGSVSSVIDDKINNLSATYIGTTNQYVTSITQTNGIISATFDTVETTSDKIKRNSPTVLTDQPNVECALTGLNKLINENSTNATQYIISAGTSTDENILESWQLYQRNGDAGTWTKTPNSNEIKIYKDQSLSGVQLSGQTLIFTYILSGGNTSEVNIDLSNFLSQAEFLSGLTVDSDGHVLIKKDEASEDYFFVNEDTIGVSGIYNAITGQVDTEKTSRVADDTYISGQVDILSSAIGEDLNEIWTAVQALSSKI